MRVCPSQAISQKPVKPFIDINRDRGGCLGYQNASPANYIELDLHSKSNILIMKIINNNKYSIILETVQAMPVRFAVIKNKCPTECT